MKYFVQGRKRGFSVLYPVPTPQEFYDFAMDNQSISAQNQPSYYGKALYSIALVRGGRIFSKYVLGYDVQRSNLGNISFSVFIPDDKVLPGGKTVELLDKLAANYFSSYAPDYYITDVQENWDALLATVSPYEAFEKTLNHLDVEHLEGSRGDAAFIYYDSPAQLAEYFDAPYQQLYTTYSQVFLVDRVFSGRSDNPLTALKHSSAADLTGKIDLGNKKYRLVINESDILVTVKKLTPTGEVTIMNNDKFFKKDELRIGWSKEFHVPGVETGTIQTLSHYLSVDENARTVTVLPVKLNPIRKEIQPQFIMNGRPVQMEKIYCRTAFGDEVPYDAVLGVFRFEGENVKKNWTITGVDHTGEISAKADFTPETVSNVFPIRVSQKKNICFDIVNSITLEPVGGFEILMQGDKKRKFYFDNIEFKDEEINQFYMVTISAKGYKPYGPFHFNPGNSRESWTIKLDPIVKKTEQHKAGGKDLGRLGKLLVIILGSLLFLSLCLNAILLINASRAKRQLRYETEVKAAKEYLQGSEYKMTELEKFANLKSVQGDEALSQAIQTAKKCRKEVDEMQAFNDYTWKLENMGVYKNESLVKLFELCKDDDNIITLQKKKHIRDLWKENIKEHSIKEVYDSLAAFTPVQEPEKQEAQTKDQLPATQVNDNNGSAPAAESASEKQGQIEEGENAAKVYMPKDEKMLGLLKRFFSKKNKDKNNDSEKR